MLWVQGRFLRRATARERAARWKRTRLDDARLRTVIVSQNLPSSRMALVLSVPLTGFSLLLMLPGARSRLLGWAAPRCLRTLERLWDRHPWAVDTSIVLLTLGICLVLV